MRIAIFEAFNAMKIDAAKRGDTAMKNIYKGYPNANSGTIGMLDKPLAQYLNIDPVKGLIWGKSGNDANEHSPLAHMSHLSAITDWGKILLAETLYEYGLVWRLRNGDTDSAYLAVYSEKDAWEVFMKLHEPRIIAGLPRPNGIIDQYAAGCAKIEIGFEDPDSPSENTVMPGKWLCRAAPKTYSVWIGEDLKTTACGYECKDSSNKKVDFYHGYDFKNLCRLGNMTEEADEAHESADFETLSTMKAVYAPWGIHFSDVPYRPKPGVLLTPEQRGINDGKKS